MEQEPINSYLIFRLGKEDFAANAAVVLHILELIKITEVPNAPDYMKGVVNLRGTVLPVIDTRIKFGMTPTEYSSNTCIIVFEVMHEDETIQIGALVDSVISVMEIEEEEIKQPPAIRKKLEDDFVRGLVDNGEKFIMVIETNKVFANDDILDLSNIQDVELIENAELETQENESEG